MKVHLYIFLPLILGSIPGGQITPDKQFREDSGHVVGHQRLSKSLSIKVLGALLVKLDKALESSEQRFCMQEWCKPPQLS